MNQELSSAVPNGFYKVAFSMKIFLSLFFLVLFTQAIQAQNLDSLRVVIEKMPKDTLKVRKLSALADQFVGLKSDYQSALSLHEKGLKLAEELNDVRGLFDGYRGLGSTHHNLVDYPKAVYYQQKSIKIFEDNSTLAADKRNRQRYIRSFSHISGSYGLYSDPVNAEKYALLSIDAAKKYQQDSYFGWMALGRVFIKQKNYVEAEKCLKNALEDHKKSMPVGLTMATIYSDLGNTTNGMGKYQESLEYHLEANKWSEKIKNLFGIRLTLQNIADSYLMLKNYPKANEYMTKSLQYIDPKNNGMMTEANYLLTNIAIAEGKTEEAIRYANICAEYALKTGRLDLKNKAYSTLFKSHKAAKNFEKALFYFEKNRESRDSLYSVEMSRNTSELVKKYEIERKEQQIGFLATENQLKQEKIEKVELLRLAMDKENQLQDIKIQQSEELIEQGNALQLSLKRENELSFQNLQKEKQLSQALTDENRLKQANLSKEKRIGQLLMAGLGLLLAFVVILFALFKKLQKDNRLIQQQSENLKTLMREIHHRVRNNLQVIGSILRLQGRNIKDEAAQVALQASESRLQSIAIIHEKLYQSENISQVSLKDYLQELVEIIKSQQDEAKAVQVLIEDKQNIKTNLDTAVHLGLIINELVTNSFKYAFKTGQEGEIKLILQSTADSYQLSFKDNGPGLPDGQFVSSKNTLGMRLINILTKQLRGSIEYRNDNGAEFLLHFQSI